MPRVVPSQVRAVIKRLYSDVETELSQKGATFPISKAVVRAIVELLNDVPAELITLEADDYANFSVNLSALRVARDSDHPVFGVGNTEIVTLPESDHTPLRVIYDLLAKCRDQAPTAGTSGLEFIIDFALRGDLRTDLSAAYSALMNHEYKAATVLAGSVVEGLLLWALEKEGDADLRQTAVTAKVKVPDDALNEWTLGPMIATAHACKVITGDTKKLTEVVQNFRNLIHPGRAARLKEICDHGTALAALAAVEKVAADLMRKYGARSDQ